ncbi:MAG: ParA family protein [Alphaproteobacteria bacterium]|jgi:chromosome partitioning protein
MKKPKIITVTNQKGGVGKTTTAINLATSLVAIGKTCTILDVDSQGNASTGLGIEANNREKNSYKFLASLCSFEEARQKTLVPNLFIVPSVVDISALDVELSSHQNREFLLKKRLEESNIVDDYIIIDTPPSLSLITINALCCSDEVLIPLQCEFFAIEGLAYLMSTIKKVKKNLNPTLEIMGVVLTMYDKRNRITADVENDIRQYMGNKVFDTVIPRNVKMSEAPSFGKPALIYDMNCSGSMAYINLAKEIVNKNLI